MAKVTWKLPDGSKKEADVSDGINLMEAALSNGVSGVIGECGGNLSCATCHVFVSSAWLAKTGTISDFEDSMLDATEAERQPNSRLSCQLVSSPELDGIVLEVPKV